MSRRLLEDSKLNITAYAGYEFRVGRGCKHCRGTGYKGRKAVGELLTLNDEIREAIIGRAPVRQLKELASRAGVRLIDRAPRVGAGNELIAFLHPSSTAGVLIELVDEKAE